MIEAAFLDALAGFLKTGAALVPTPAGVGVVAPAIPQDLPAIVLALPQTRRVGGGLGERSALVTDGALSWTATIDLANPVLPDDPSFNLLSADRFKLVLPHGGLVRADGSSGLLTSADLTVTVAGTSVEAVTAAPAASQVQADPQVGVLTFGDALPQTGLVVATYFLGVWEQRVARIAGTLTATVVAADAKITQQLSDKVVAALPDGAKAAIAGLHEISVQSLSSIAQLAASGLSGWARDAAFAFDYELAVNRPDSSGGIIQRIPVNALLS